MIIPILVALIALSIMVLVHEWGHFIVAKKSGIVVEVFSIGMGPRLFGYKHKGTDYRLSLFPFGGYVKFLGDDMEKIDEEKNIPGGFFSASPWSRIAVCFAGGGLNIVFAFILYTVIFFVGKTVPYDYYSTSIGGVELDSASEIAGITLNDSILSVNGEPVDTWEKIIYACVFSKTDELLFEIDRDGEIFTKEIILPPDEDKGLRFPDFYKKRDSIVVAIVVEDSIAEEAGLEVNDQILEINNEKIFCLELLISTIRQNEGEEITLTVLRDDSEVEIKAIPKKELDSDYAAIGFAPVVNITEWIKIYPKPWEQFKNDLIRTWQTLSGLVTRRIPVKQVSGPVGIVKLIGLSMLGGWGSLLAIVALISLNLGIINLLPIPVLDGGHILFNLVEVVRKKPLSVKMMIWIQNIFVGLLILIALYVTYNDILRFF